MANNIAVLFPADDRRRIDPKFRPPRFAQYLDAVERLVAAWLASIGR